MSMTLISQNLQAVRAAITEAEAAARRPEGSVTLVAVSKTFGADAAKQALFAGQRVFGENYVQEAKEKWPELQEEFPDSVLHMIGPLQSNKTRDAVALFDCIQSLDRPSLARELAKEIDKQGHSPRLLIQVNTGEEAQKGGVVPKGFANFLRQCQNEYQLKISGLMCIPPADQAVAPHFALLKQMADDHGLPELSMGMSGDFASAIGLGATMVRVGTVIFGDRSYT